MAKGILLSSNTLCPLSSHPNLTLTSEDSMKSFTPPSILKREKRLSVFSPTGKNIKLFFFFHFSCTSLPGLLKGLSLRQYSVAWLQTHSVLPWLLWKLHRGVSITSPSVCKQNPVYFSVTSGNHGEQVETLTEVSCISWAVPASPAGASPLPAGGWAQPPSEGQTLALPPEVSMTFLVPDFKGLVPNYNLEQREERLTLLIYVELEERAVCQSGNHVYPTLFRS